MTAPTEIRIYGHTKLFYWWPVWLLCFIFAAITWYDNQRLVLVPPDATVQTTDLADEVTFYREFPAVPFTALPQLGTNWEAAYQTFQEAAQCTPHTRCDVVRPNHPTRSGREPEEV